jgi:hemin uptake protein HemP
MDEVTAVKTLHLSPESARAQSAAAPSTAQAPAIPPRCIESANLLGGARELLIAHNGRQYRLRVTAQQKLILTA